MASYHLLTPYFLGPPHSISPLTAASNSSPTPPSTHSHPHSHHAHSQAHTVHHISRFTHRPRPFRHSLSPRRHPPLIIPPYTSRPLRLRNPTQVLAIDEHRVSVGPACRDAVVAAVEDVTVVNAIVVIAVDAYAWKREERLVVIIVGVIVGVGVVSRAVLVRVVDVVVFVLAGRG
jgi:hypothetical protein